MPASRWHTNPAELFDWIDENDTELLDMLMPSLFARFNQAKPETENEQQLTGCCCFSTDCRAPDDWPTPFDQVG
jgi:hypothetical protein